MQDGEHNWGFYLSEYQKWVDYNEGTEKYGLAPCYSIHKEPFHLPFMFFNRNWKMGEGQEWQWFRGREEYFPTSFFDYSKERAKYVKKLKVNKDSPPLSKLLRGGEY